MSKDDQEFNLKCLKLNCYFHFICDLSQSSDMILGGCQQYFSVKIMIFGGELVAEHNFLRLRAQKQVLKVKKRKLGKTKRHKTFLSCLRKCY